MHLYHFALNKEIEEIFVNYALTSLAKAMIGIFVPVYLLTLGFPLADIFLFYIFYFVVFALASYPAVGFLKKYGAKHTMATSIPFLIAFFLLLRVLATSTAPLLPIAIIGGISEAFYWMGFHADFSAFSNRKGREKQVSVLVAIPLVFMVMGPLAGGLIITLFDFATLFIVSSILLIASIFPLFMTPDTGRRHGGLGFSHFNRKNWRQAAGFVGEGGVEISGILFWPLAVYFVFMNNVALGFTATLEVLFAAVATLASGSLINSTNRLKVLVSSSITDSVAWLFRFFAVLFSSAAQIFGITAIGGLTKAAQTISFTSIMYEKSQKRTIDYLFFRQVMLVIGRLGFLAAGFILIAFGTPVAYLVLMTAAATLLRGVFR